MTPQQARAVLGAAAKHKALLWGVEKTGVVFLLQPGDDGEGIKHDMPLPTDILTYRNGAKVALVRN